MLFWHRLAIVTAVLIATAVVARLIDRRIARRDLPPEAGHSLPRPAPQHHDRGSHGRLPLGAAGDPAGASGCRRPARLVGGARDRDRLRVATDDRELRRRVADRVYATDPARRPRRD